MDISPPDPLDGVVALSGQDDDGACRGLQNGLLHGPGAVQLKPMDGKNIIFCSITSLHEVGRIYGFLLDAHKKTLYYD